MHRYYTRLIIATKFLLSGLSLIFFAQQEYRVYLDYSIQLTLNGLFIINGANRYKLSLHDAHIKYLNDAYILSVRSDILGILTIIDTKECLSIKATQINFDKLSGTLEAVKDKIKFIGKYDTCNIHYESGYMFYLSENTPYKKYKLQLNKDQAAFLLNCKRFSPGIHNLVIKLSKNVGHFSGQFYQMPFWGKLHCDSECATGYGWGEKISPIKLTLNHEYIVELNSEDISGIIDIKNQSAKLHVYDHNVLLLENKLHIAGPKVCVSLSMTPFLQIIGPSFICNSDLLQLALLDSMDYPAASRKYFYCDNFQAPGIKMSWIEDAIKLILTLATKHHLGYLHSTQNRISIYCSELRDFNQIITNFAVTGGALVANGARRNHKWHGKLQIENATLAPIYQVNKEKLWTITGKWSWDGRKLKFINLLIKNKHTEILLNGYIQNEYIECTGSLLKANLITNGIKIFTKRHILGTKFDIRGKLGKTKFTTSKISTLYSWISYLPI